MWQFRTICRSKFHTNHFTFAQHEIQEYQCLAFSSDDQLLVSVTGGSDSKLTFWSWGKAQIVAEIQVMTIPSSFSSC
jgi:hypothetical protein